MPDDDYSAYLKRQSYDDLVSISCLISRESQTERYQMVLAEIAEREKRGEKPETKHKQQSPVMPLLGGWFLFETVLDLMWSRPAWRVVADFVAGVLCFVVAWFSRKK
jgi:hypothetical protein